MAYENGTALITKRTPSTICLSLQAVKGDDDIVQATTTIRDIFGYVERITVSQKFITDSGCTLTLYDDLKNPIFTGTINANEELITLYPTINNSERPLLLCGDILVETLFETVDSTLFIEMKVNNARY